MKVLMINGSPNKAGCIGCGGCRKAGKCVFDDDGISGLLDKCAEADGFVFGSPVYYSHPSGRLLCILDRLFFSGSRYFRGKPGAAVVSARRAGTTASLDAINKHFTINQMPVVSSTYWNMVHGRKSEDVLQDEEGLQTMRNLGRNMAAMLKGENLPAEGNEYDAWTCFIR